MAFNMTKAEREAFLLEARVGILSIPQRNHGPLTNPVWYDYTPGGDLWILMQSTTRKGQLLRVGGRVSFLVQNPEPPYRYVSLEGSVSAITPADLRDDLQPMAQRYLGEEEGVDYADGSAEKYALGNAIKVAITPERWLTVDYSKRG
jgi:hypothetical protein